MSSSDPYMDFDNDGCAVPVERGCGTREEGGVYAECGLSKNGTPLEEFLFCPPIPIDLDELGLTKIGVHILEDARRPGIYHIFDHVGSEFYPNVPDFIEEVRRFGMSRRLPPDLDFSKLTSESCHYLLHERGLVTNAREFYADWCKLDAPWFHRDDDYLNPCAADKAQHTFEFLTAQPAGLDMCSGVWYQDIVDGEPVESDGLEEETPFPTGVARLVRRVMPSFQYTAAKRPESIQQVYYQEAVFMRLPITRLVVVRDNSEGKHEQRLEAAKASKLKVDLVEE